MMQRALFKTQDESYTSQTQDILTYIHNIYIHIIHKTEKKINLKL